MVDLPAWARADGLPSTHVARAALHVAAIVDRRGSPTNDAQESYWHHATGGTFAPTDLNRGQRLLLDAGLLVERDGTLVPSPQLSELLDGSADDALAAVSERAVAVTGPRWLADATGPPEALAKLVPDPARREELLLALGRRFDETRRRLVGEIGEELVIDAARAELRALGHVSLAREVHRVSLVSDQLGYDVTAPRIEGPPRLLEVKSTTGDVTGPSISLHLSRNEADTGRALADWALVVCAVEDTDRRRGRIVGRCTAAALENLLPVDGPQSRWEQAEVDLPIERLAPGLPGVVA